MPTVAQTLVEQVVQGYFPVQNDKVIQLSTTVAALLAAASGSRFDDGTPPRPVEQFHFDERVVQSALSVFASKESTAALRKFSRLPVLPRVWFEWYSHKIDARCGIMLDQGDSADNPLTYVVFFSAPGGAVPAAHGVMHMGDGATPSSFEWMPGVFLESAPKSLIQVPVATALCLCAFLALPKIVESKPVEWAPKLQAKRQKRGKPALMSYKVVTLRLPKSGGVPSHGGDGTHAGKRLHQVIGHLRLTNRGEAEPEYIWVSPHWRGDSSLGVVLKTRKVEMDT